LRDICARHDTLFYPRFKQNCDDYFQNRHRGGEARGIGGIFFDHLRDLDRLPFVIDVGRSLAETYAPIVAQRRRMRYGERERAFQLYRRGRYVEFNLLHDRGTAFGLHTNARVESVLMSLPPLAAWTYAPTYAAGSFESRLVAMLAPQDWTAACASSSSALALPA
jgi:coproporphyrinogen III oxidase